jgi:anti-sigma regulatory factor (Ser/Thr protein kinase)
MRIPGQIYVFADAGVGMPPLASIRAWLRGRLTGVGADTVADAELLATELVANAHEHGAGCTALRLSMPTGREVLRLEVDDRGPYRQLRSPPTPQPEATRGRGLTLIAAISTSWGVRAGPGHKTVWAEMSLA